MVPNYILERKIDNPSRNRVLLFIPNLTCLSTILQCQLATGGKLQMGFTSMPESNNPTFRLLFKPLKIEPPQSLRIKSKNCRPWGRSNCNHALWVWDFQIINHTRKSTVFPHQRQIPVTSEFGDLEILE